MKTGTGEKNPPVEVPQYEEYKTASWAGMMLRLVGGIGGAFALTGCLILWVSGQGGAGLCLCFAAGFLLMFLIPTVLDRRRIRENREIEARNQEKYDRYKKALDASAKQN